MTLIRYSVFGTGADDFFDPTSDTANLNTFTKRDHVFVKLNFQLEGGTITLLHKEKSSAPLREAAFIQLEFSGNHFSIPAPHTLFMNVLLASRDRRFLLMADTFP